MVTAIFSKQNRLARARFHFIFKTTTSRARWGAVKSLTSQVCFMVTAIFSKQNRLPRAWFHLTFKTTTSRAWWSMVKSLTSQVCFMVTTIFENTITYHFLGFIQSSRQHQHSVEKAWSSHQRCILVSGPPLFFENKKPRLFFENIIACHVMRSSNPQNNIKIR